jgi:hypothetical protein
MLQIRAWHQRKAERFDKSGSRLHGADGFVWRMGESVTGWRMEEFVTGWSSRLCRNTVKLCVTKARAYACQVRVYEAQKLNREFK